MRFKSAASDAGDSFTVATMNRAFRLIQDGAALIALECDRYWMDVDGLSLSAGPFVPISAVQSASECGQLL